MDGSKIGHFLVCGTVAASVTLVTKRPFLGILTGVGVGLAKETYDEYSTNGTGFDITDVIANNVGAGLGGIIGGIVVIGLLSRQERLEKGNLTK